MDKNKIKVVEDLSSFTAEDDARMAVKIDQLHIRDSSRTYILLADKCFKECVDSFYRKNINKAEETCVERCANKFIRHSMRTGLKFAELSQEAELKFAELMSQEAETIDKQN
ncbi:tim10/DDP family zinc finger [Artemisia annua]|uniref:Mitochondrial import inner membrane translocase subunit n=1 Tax=Artemisia annua TaxID=35608 RepID=A0A2U1K8Z4_ARTAN|nr:tim10/DDP family zinc finger [Artemisia annua]PWA59873.1 tim10/DDP family zinc finger [Artemisia annua]